MLSGLTVAPSAGWAQVMTDESFAVQESLRSPSAGKSVNGMLDVTERVTCASACADESAASDTDGHCA
eukprot:COSAG04_NODE_28261_length_277_cov_0.331461_1_plen_67_part_10